MSLRNQLEALTTATGAHIWDNPNGWMFLAVPRVNLSPLDLDTILAKIRECGFALDDRQDPSGSPTTHPWSLKGRDIRTGVFEDDSRTPRVVDTTYFGLIHPESCDAWQM